MDVPATGAGKITEVLLKRGDKVSKGSLIARLEAAGAGGAAPARCRTGRTARAAAAPAPPARAAGCRGAQPPGAGDTVRMPAPRCAKPPRRRISRTTQLLVLGSGPGGYTAAFRAADLGLKVTLVER